MQSALATIITIICRTHIDPLNSKAAAALAINNFRYFGLPIELIFLALINTNLALEVWIFGKFGLIAGSYAAVASFCGVLYTKYIWYSVFYWKNKELSPKVREKRERLRKRIWKELFPYNVYHALKDEEARKELWETLSSFNPLHATKRSNGQAQQQSTV